jgi:hypothetical protein
MPENGMTNMPSAGEERSFVTGGLFYQLFIRSGLLRPPMGLVSRRIMALVLIAWLPLLLLTAMNGTFMSGVSVPFIEHLSIHIRLLVCLPILLLGEVNADHLSRLLLDQFSMRGLITDSEKDRFSRAVSSALKPTDSMLMDAIILLLAFSGGHWLWEGHIALHAPSWYAPSGASSVLSAAGYWYAFISLPLFRFFLFRWYFRLMILYRLLWNVSRIHLQLNAMHPDRAGGLGFMKLSTNALIPLFAAQTILLSSKIADRIWHESATILQYRIEIVMIVIIFLFLMYIPMTFFSLQLHRARRQSLLEYGIFASQYVSYFRTKWLQHTPSGQEIPELVGNSNIRSPSDLAAGFDAIRETRLIPVSKRSFLQTGIIIVLPLLPLFLTLVPMEILIERLIKLAL